MRAKKKMSKLLSTALAAAMMVSMLPGMMTVESSAAIAENESVIRLPITIRDFKQDSIFFQISNSMSPGVISAELSADGTPVYNETAIDELAGKINGTTRTGHYPNYVYVSEIESSVINDDLKSVLLQQYNANSDTWDDVSSDWNSANAVEKLEDATTACQAADWMLRNIFVNSSFVYDGTTYDYGKLVPEYDTLVLRAIMPGTTNTPATYTSMDTGETFDCFVYNSGWNRSSNSTTTSYPTVFDRYESTEDTEGGMIYNDPDGVGLTNGGYFPLDERLTGGALGFGEEISSGSYNGNMHNYHMTTTGSGQFVYHAEDDLFFAFDGDDDVLLFINGKLVIDDSGIHGAHPSEIFLESSAKSASNQSAQARRYRVATDVTDNTTTWAQWLGLVEGEVYRFDFFQMERNKSESNFSMYTNINVVDSSAVPQKKAYLNGQQLTYGAFVPQGSDITYGFSLTNSGQANIKNLTFVDALLGVNLNKSNPVIGDNNEYSDLEYALYETKEGAPATYSKIADDDALIKLLTDGIPVGFTLEIRGFHYNVGSPEGTATTKTVPNTLQTTAQGPSRNDPSKLVTIKGSASMRVRTLQVQNATFVMDYAKTFTLTNEQIFGTELYDLSKSITVTDTQEETTTTVQLADNLQSVALKSGAGKYGTMVMSDVVQKTEGNVTYPTYTMTYTPSTILQDSDSFLVEIDVKSTTTYEDETTETSSYSINKSVTILPANNVYYEDDLITTAGGDWSVIYDGMVTQTPEGWTENTETVDGAVMGWEASLADDTKFSDGSAIKDTVKGGTATFTFTGTGVDIYSYTDMESGIVTASLVKLKADGSVDTSVATQYLMVDNLAVSGEYYQVPTLSFQGLNHGTYKVTLVVNRAKAVQLDEDNNPVVDENGDPVFVTGTTDDCYRSTYYLDGVRVYNPLGSTVYNDAAKAYVSNATSVTSQFKSVKSLIDSAESVFTDWDVDGTVGAKDYYKSDVYTTYGPKNEVYLAPGNAVTFAVEGTGNVYVGAKALNGVAVNLECTNGDSKTTGTITHSTDLYYQVIPNSNGLITVKNVSGGILALTKVQLVEYTTAQARMMMALRPVTVEETEDYVEEFETLPEVEYDPTPDVEIEEPEVPTDPEPEEPETPDEPEKPGKPDKDDKPGKGDKHYDKHHDKHGDKHNDKHGHKTDKIFHGMNGWFGKW